VPSVEERLAYLEGRAEEQTRAMDEFRDSTLQFHHRIDGLDHRMDRLEHRFDALDVKVDRFREELGGRIDRVREEMVQRFDGLQGRFDDVDSRFERMDEKASRTFLWIVGVQITTLVAVIGALVGT
jgi:uncharacterized coiled-coil protein SlyX